MRIELAHDGSALLTVMGGALRIVELDGTVRAEIPHRILDARWPAGRIVAFDADSRLRWYDARGALVDTREIPWGRFPAVAASLSADGHRIAAKTQFQIIMVAATGDRVWGVDNANNFGLSFSEFESLNVALSDSGQIAAVGYEITAWEQREPGRGWLVAAVDDNRLLDRALLKTPLEPGASAFAFDRAGKRFAYSTPERIRTGGAIRIGKRGPSRLDRDGGARAVAFDRRGVVAAWAYRGKLRVDYLDPRAPGSTSIDIADTLYLEPALPDIVAITFSPDGRSIACLATDGTTEIVVVP